MFLKYGPERVLADGNLLVAAFLSTVFIGCSLALLRYNHYPAKIFVGDVYTYFAGCIYVTSAVVGNYLIASGFLYFMQLINFGLSIP